MRNHDEMISVITPSIRPEYLYITQACLERQTDQDFEWLVEVGLKNRGFTLPKDWNKLIQRAGNSILILQDCISIPDDAIERVRTLNLDRKAYTFPVSKEGAWDWRNSEEKKLTPNEWEADLAYAPKEMFMEVGGFDERFCDGWSWENVELAWRAGAAGYEFFNSHSIKGEAVDHDAKQPHPFRDSLPKNDWRANETMRRAERGDYKLPYLY